MTIDPLTNSVIFVDQASNARTLIGLLKTIDINVLKEVSMEVLPLHSITPQDAVQGMKTLMSQLGKFKESAIGSSLALIPLENFGGVLIMARTPELLQTARQWLTAMDAQGVGNQEQIHVYFVQNGMASDIAQILSEVLGISTGAAAKGQKVVPSGTRVARTAALAGPGAVLSVGPGAARLAGPVPRHDRRFRGHRDNGCCGLRTSGAAAAQTVGAAAKGKPPGFTGQVMIIADEANNAIVVQANPADYAKLLDTIKKLDILPRAVMIEVMIAEVNLTKQFQFGLQYYFQTHPATNTGFGASFGGLSNATTTTTSPAPLLPNQRAHFPSISARWQAQALPWTG